MIYYLQYNKLFIRISLENETDARPVIDFLLSKNADINARDDDDSTPLHNAVSYSNTTVVKHLVSMLLQLN